MADEYRIYYAGAEAALSPDSPAWISQIGAEVTMTPPPAPVLINQIGVETAQVFHRPVQVNAMFVEVVRSIADRQARRRPINFIP